MAAHYLKEIRRVQPEGPYHFLGYSFGGIVVLEMAHQLRAVGETVGLLGMLDTRARDYIRGTPRKQPPAQSAKQGRLMRIFSAGTEATRAGKRGGSFSQRPQRAQSSLCHYDRSQACFLQFQLF